MKRCPHVEEFSPEVMRLSSGVGVSDEDKEKIKNWDLKINEVNPDHLVYALKTAWTGAINTLLATVEDLAGPEMAAKVADEFQARQGYNQWKNFLRLRGLEHGNPAVMAEYQDIGHSMRGQHWDDYRWAQFDDKRVVVFRTACQYWTGRPAGTGRYVKEFCGVNPYKGFLRGYMDADPALDRIELEGGLCRGFDTCKLTWVYK